MPRLPGESPSATPLTGHRNHGTLLGLLFMAIFAAGFLGLIVAILPDAAGLFMLFAGFVAFFAFHYFTWGRWLTRHFRNTGQMKDQDPS